jgi:hypothetical protein
MPERPALAVIGQAAERADLRRVGVEPPVQEIEVVRRLVHPQGSALGPVAMPAAEIVGAVRRVEVPRKIDGRDLPDLARHQDFLDLLVLRRVAIVEGDDHLLAGALLGVEHRLALLLVDHHRLLGHDVDAAAERLDDVIAVEAVDGGDHQEVRLRLVHHLVEVRERRTRDTDRLFRRLEADRVDVGQTDEFHAVGITPRNRRSPHADPADPGSDDGVAPFRLRAKRGSGRGQDGADRGAGGGRDELAAGHAVAVVLVMVHRCGSSPSRRYCVIGGGTI